MYCLRASESWLFNGFSAVLKRRVEFEGFTRVVAVTISAINYLFMDVKELPVNFVLSVLCNSLISLSHFWLRRKKEL